jgi:CBS domain-containing protein
MLKVRDIMTPDVITLRPDMTLEEASGVFAQNHVSGAPVVANAEVVGVVSQSDILEFVTAASTAGEPGGIDVRAPEEESERRPLPTWEEESAMPASFFSQRWTEPDESSAAQLIESEALSETAGYEVTLLAAHTVDEVMTRAIHAVHPGAEVVTVADYMRRVGIHRVLVMDGKKLLGILTSLDVATAVADHRLERRVYVFGRRADDRGAGDAG